MDVKLPKRVRIVEVGPRDGLQNEAEPIPTGIKVLFIQALVNAGLQDIEATSFVSPKAVPQLADAEDVARALPQAAEVLFSALVPNDKGLNRAVENNVQRIAVFTAASDTFSRKNIRMDIGESLAVFDPVIRRALREGISVRGYVSTAFECPFEGRIDREKVREVTERLLMLGVDEVAISDTMGTAAPQEVFDTVGWVLETVPAERLALHLHDTYGTALANVLAGLQLGITTFDAAAGGLGGCPFAPGAAGNVATEDLVYLLDRMGIDTGVSLERVVDAAAVLAGHLKRPLRSRQWQRLKGSKGTCEN